MMTLDILEYPMINEVSYIYFIPLHEDMQRDFFNLFARVAIVIFYFLKSF